MEAGGKGPQEPGEERPPSGVTFLLHPWIPWSGAELQRGWGIFEIFTGPERNASRLPASQRAETRKTMEDFPSCVVTWE